MTVGTDQIQKLRALGASEEELTVFEQNKRRDLAGAGATAAEIDNFFGQGPVDYHGTDKTYNKQAVLERSEEGPPEGQDLNLFQAINAGYQASITGVVQRQAAPDIIPAEGEDLWDLVAFSLAQSVGDLPVSIPAFIAGAIPGAKVGAPIGAGIGAAVTGGPGAVPGAAVGAIFGGAVTGGTVSGFVTADVREALIQFYEDNEGQDVNTREFLVGLTTAMMSDRVLEAAKKEAVVGGATGLAGPIGRGLARPVGSRVLTETVVTSAEMAAAVGTISAMEGRMPTKEDFALAAGAVATFKAGEVAFRRGRTGRKVVSAEEKLFKDIEKRVRDIYARTGESPVDVAQRAEADPVLHQQLITGEEQIATNSDVTDTAPRNTHIDSGEAPERLVINSEEIDPRNAVDVGPDDPSQTKFTDAGKPPEPELPVPVEPTDAPVDVARSEMQKGMGIEDVPPKPPKEPLEPPDRPEDVIVAREAIRGQIKQKKQKRFGTDDFRYNFINDLQFMVSASEKAFQAETGRRLAIEQNPGELARLSAGAHGIADLEIKRGIFDPVTGKKTGDSLTEVVGRIPKEDRAFFNEYQVSKRVMEKAGQELNTGFNEDAAAIVVKAGDIRPDFVKAQKEIQVWHDAGIKRLVDSGMLSEARAGAMKELNQDFVPFFRLMYEDGVTTPVGVSSRGIPVRNPVKKFKGSDKPILNPYEVMVKNRYTLTQLTENNRARQRLVDFSAGLSEENQFVTRLGKPRTLMKDLEVDRQFKEWLNDNGLDQTDAPEFATYWSLGKRLADDEFLVYEGGDPIVYRAHDPDLVRSLSAMDGGSMNMIFRILAVPSAIMRAGTVLSPDFITRATIRDNLSSVLLNAFEVVPIGDAVIGMSSILKKDADFIKWIEAGGANAALLDLDRNILSNGMLDEATMRTLNLGSVWNTATTPYRMLAYVSTLMENSMRVGQFKRSMKKGETLQTAALRARDVSLDFHRMGAQVRAWNSISAFLGASINGLERTAASFKNTPKSTFVKGLALLTLPSILLWWANKDEEWYKNIPEWKKATFWSFRVGGSDENPMIFHIPMPLVYGTMFGYVPVKIMDAYVNDTPGAFEDISEQIIKSISLDPTPVGLSPMIDIATNHNGFTQRPLVSDTLERSRLPEYRYTPYTTEVAKAVAKFLNVFQGVVPERFRTPIAVDHIVQQWSGALGVAALRTVDKGLQIVGAVDEQIRPTDTRIPVIKGFFSRHLDGRGQIDDFYKHANKIDQIIGTIKAMELEERFDEADKLDEKFGNLIFKTNRYRKSISNLYNVARGIAFEPETSPEEKRQLVDDLMQEIIWIAEDFNEEFAFASKEE